MGSKICLLARVECREESRAQERPVAVWIGGTRAAVRVIIDDAILGAVAAGQTTRRRVVVELEDDTRVELVRALPTGDWRVYRSP